MKKFIFIPLAILMIFLLFPKTGLAVEYSINDMKIKANLQKDGNVEVQETQTYSFNGDFNGITREIFAKNGTSIANFRAEENGKSLKVEKDKNVYRIYRKGSDEVIVINLFYTIKNGVDVYSDTAEFYWPFFDNRNQSTYDNLSITIHPPSATNDVIALGYDQAFGTEKVMPNGSVLFNLGEVPSEENGDIRVAYDANLFPASQNIQQKSMKESFLSEKNKMIEDAALYKKEQERTSLFGNIGLSVLFIILFGSMYLLFLKQRNKKADILRNISTSFTVPNQIMTLPATIFYTNQSQLPAEAMGAALLDLLRKGIIEKTEENSFRLVNQQKNLKKHEQLLIDFLFFKVGKKGIFNFNDLKLYINKEQNHQNYHFHQIKWKHAIKQELTEHALYEKNTKINCFFVFMLLPVLPFLYYFPSYKLFGLLFAAILFIIVALAFSLFYRPKTYKGLELLYQWKALQNNFNQITKSEWEKLSEDERIRIYIYGLGLNDKDITRKNEALGKSVAFPKINLSQPTTNYFSMDIFTIYYFGTLASTNFYDANKLVDKTLNNSSGSGDSSSYTGGGGGGVGGGGGGSGAF
ncbi:MAG: DUF2207 domain-containing protein [Bacillus sp. (in: firmicutes)]